MLKFHFDVLGIAPTEDIEQIKKAYKKKALQLHPDKNKSPEAKAEFQALLHSYQVLFEKYNISLENSAQVKPDQEEDSVLSDVNKEIQKLFSQNLVFSLAVKIMNLRREVVKWIQEDHSSFTPQILLHELKRLIEDAQLVKSFSQYADDKNQGYLDSTINKAIQLSRYFLFYLVWLNYPQKSPQDTFDTYQSVIYPDLDLMFGRHMLYNPKGTHLFDFYKEDGERIVKKLLNDANYIHYQVEFRELNQAIIKKLKRALPQEIQTIEMQAEDKNKERLIQFIQGQINRIGDQKNDPLPWKKFQLEQQLKEVKLMNVSDLAGLKAKALEIKSIVICHRENRNTAPITWFFKCNGIRNTQGQNEYEQVFDDSGDLKPNWK